jgi:acetyl esterase
MSLEQIENIQATVLPQNLLTRLLLGTLQPGVSVADRTIPGPEGPLLLRIYTPEPSSAIPRPLVVYIHGGGWVLGSTRVGDWMCSTVARAVDAVVVSVEYRLAPRHKFPAAVEDCYAALVWCSEHAAALGADAGRIGIMGESAGGNLAAVTCLAARDCGGPQVCHQALIYPATDGSMATPSHQQHKDAIILSAADAHAFYQHYVAADTDPRDWRLSPLHAVDHTRLPPAIIVVAGHDPLHDEGVLYAAKLQAAGVPVILKDYPAMPHGFANFPHLARDTRLAFDENTSAQRAALHSAAS